MPAPRPRPSAPASELAERLLEAHVDYVVAELTGDRLAATIAREVDDVLTVAGTLVLADVVDPAQVKRVARRGVDTIGGSALVETMVGEVTDAGYQLAAGEDFRLGEVIDRADVSALVEKVLSLHTLHERLLERTTESPLVATVASRFVSKIIADFVQQNRARAEKVPGMSSLLSLGGNAASRVRSATDRHLDQFLGDAAGKGAQYALRRTNSAILELIRDAPVHEAVLEIWDLHAEEPIGRLREYISSADLRELAQLGHQLIANARTSEYTAHLLDAAIDVFFEQYGQHDLAALLGELGIGRDDVVDDLIAFAPPVLDALQADGVLADQVRKRLAPFYRSPAVATLLADT
jgi:hypothetical protein